MPDLNMSWNGDLAVSTTGDLAVLEEPGLGTQRVLRRLMTNPGDYIWNPSYGAGLGRFVGQPTDAAGIQALILSQMTLEAAVAQSPEPIISVDADTAGRLYAQIRYADASTASSTSFSFSISG